MTRTEIVKAIVESPLDDEDLNQIIAVCTRVTMANALMGAGMDLLAQSVLEDAEASDDGR